MRRPITLKSFIALSLFSLALNTSSATAQTTTGAATGRLDETYKGSRYQDIYATVFQKPYTELPHYRINKRHFGPGGNHLNNRVLNAGLRTLRSRADLMDFPGGQKLFQANGICFAGQWRIDTDSPYSGLFAKGAQARVIARASVSLNGTEQKHKRAFGMALKFFRGADPQLAVATDNVFVMHSLGGVRTRHLLDLALDNEPPLGSLPPFGQWLTARRLQKDFQRADTATSGLPANVGYRPVSSLAQVVGKKGDEHAPRWLRLTAADSLRMNQKDFRDELSLEHYPGQVLRWTISVAAATAANDKQQASWENIGTLSFSESIASKACDQRLHFAHPRLAPNRETNNKTSR